MTLCASIVPPGDSKMTPGASPFPSVPSIVTTLPGASLGPLGTSIRLL